MRAGLNLGTARLSAAIAALVLAAGCADLVSADLAKYVEREEKHFAVTGKPDVSLATFDGAIEVRPWNRSDVQVVIEKRATNKESVATIQVEALQTADHIVTDVKAPRREGFHWNDRRSAKLIVSLPAASDVIARSGDGAIDIEGIDGRMELRSGDGGIRGHLLHGDVTAHTGDGTIRLDGVQGALDVDTGDGGVVAAGSFTTLRAHSGDGSVDITAEPGSSTSSEWSITTGDGSVNLALPDGFGAEIDAHTGDGRIHVQDLTLANVTGESKNSVRGRVGSGGGTVRVRTGDGSITLKKR